MSTVATVTAAVLLAVAALHAVWLFSPWPLRTSEDLVRTVMGRPEGTVDRAVVLPATVVVAAALAGAAYLVAVAGGALGSDLSPRLVEAGTWVVAAVLLARGVAGLVHSGLRLGDAPESYRRLDLAAYSPLCLLLGASVAAVALG